MTLQEELTTDPLNRGYQAWIPNSPGVLVDMMNAYNYTLPKERFVSARGLLAAYGAAGATILDKLEAAAASISEIKWALSFLKSDSGIDVGHQNTRTLVDELATNSVLTTTEADQIKDLANQPASRAEVLGLARVTEADIRSALGL
jgi:hypothetical protein